MNILFLIGNGFDINLGMETRYPDFYNYYHSIESSSENIKELKNHISVNIENWSDLEIALGEYTEFIKSVEEFDEVFEDIVERLGDYLEVVENQYFEKDNVNKKWDEIFNYLSFPEKALSKADEESIISFKDQWQSYQWKVEIITFNYTRTMERITGMANNELLIGIHNGSIPINLKSIEHIHGYVEDRMILGVNDLSQIKNTLFHQEQNILESIIKEKCNAAHKHTIDRVCKNKISSADLICIFGSSLGDTDKIWWELIGEQLRSGCRLLIFDRCKNISQRLGYKKARREREVKDYFLSKTNLKPDEKEKFKDYIFVGVNTNMFKL